MLYRPNIQILNLNSYNTKKLKSQVKILDKADKIFMQEKREKSRNAKLNLEIKKAAENRGEKPCYRVISNVQLEKLKQTEVKFAYFKKEDKYNIIFLKADEFEVNKTIKSAGLAQ